MLRNSLLSLALGTGLASAIHAQDCNVFFSEYAEGSSSNKYVELYNPTGSAVALDGMTIELYSNGSTDVTGSMTLAGSLAAEGVALYANSNADAVILALATETNNSAINFNGNDALVLRAANGDVLDVIGEIGSSANFAVAGADTKDNTIVRKAGIGAGTTDWAAAAGTDAETSEWIALPSNDWSNAGAHTSTAACTAAPTNEFTMRVLHNNDGESSLLGVDHFAAAVAAERAAAEAEGIPSIMLSSGDNFLAGAIFTISQSEGVYYDALALDRIGYDALCLGNHDFDFGPSTLADFINSYELTTPPYLSANLDFSTEPALAGLATSGRILPSTVLEVAGEQVAVIGLTTPLLNGISSPGLVGINSDIVTVVQNEVDALTADGINKIILVSHLQSVATDMDLASQVSGVDLIIAGGGDQLLTNSAYSGVHDVYGAYPLTTTDAAGETSYLVTTIGNYQFLGSIKLTFDANGMITDVHSEESDVIEIDMSEGAASDADMYNTVVAPLEAALAVTQVVANSEIAFDVRKPIIRSRETGVGNVIADAYLNKAQEWALMEGHDVPQFGMANGGGIRSNTIYPAGDITDQDAGNILPFPNYIAIMEDVPSDVVKLVLENAYSQTTMDETGEIVGDDGRFAHIAGATVVYDMAGTAYTHDASGEPVVTGTRVVSFTLEDGTVVIENGEAVAGVTVDIASVDFSLNGGDFYPFHLAGSPVLVSEYAALDAFIDFLMTDLSGTVSAVDYPEDPGVDAGRIQVLAPTCDDETACTYGQDTFCFYADDCGVCNGDGSSCVEGCTDPIACNYYDLAVIDDGSCIVPTPGNPCPTTVEVFVTEGLDDVEEQMDEANPYYSGLPYTSSSDLELTFDGGEQEVGIRFASLDVPSGAVITEAYIQFTADASHDGETNLFVHVEDVVNAPTYDASAMFNVSDRTKYQMPVAWSNVPAWTAGLAGMEQRTPDLADLVQHIIDKNDWASGNAINFIITGTGRREAESFENDEANPALAPKLVVSYQELSGEGCTDDAASNYDPAATTDDGSCTYAVSFQVESGSDDIEETLNSDATYYDNGLPYMDSSDLELVQDGDANQAVGVRFTGLNIAQGQTIASAYIQFGVDEVSMGACALEIAIADAANTATFDSEAAYAASGLATTGDVVDWDVPEWLTVGEAGADQRTPDLASLLQTIVDKADWNPYQAVTFILTGEGTRTAEAFEGNAALAPQLVVEVVGDPVLAQGCTDATASNYDPAAGVDDGSCLYLTTATIAEIQQGQLTEAFTGLPVATSGVVTYVNGSFFIIQDGDGPWSGISVYSSGHGLSVGDNIAITGSVTEYNGLTELVGITDITVQGTAAVPTAAVVSTGDLNDEQWESVYVATTGDVTALANTYGEWLINDGTGDVQVDDYDLAVPADLALGQTWMVEGPLTYAYNAFELRAMVQNLVPAAPQPCQLGVVYVSEAHTSGEPNDYIEIYNSGAEDCLLTGFQLDDNVELADLTFGDVVIEAGGYWLGYEDAPGSFTSGLSSGGDLVVFADPEGNTLIVEAGPSIGILSKSFDAEGNGCYTLPTPGEANDACGVVGCTDEAACNYNAEATADDGSCTFSDGIIACDGTCFNDADGDGICDENEGLAGCTDASAENYNPQANEDDGSCWLSDLAYTIAGTHGTGQFDAGAAEIVDYHAGTQRLFYVNASASTVDALDMSDPNNLTLAFTFDATAYGASANGIVVFGDYVAVAIEAAAIDQVGQIVIIDTDGNFVSSAPAGYLPDAVTVSHDGTTLAVSNEGQPSEDYTYDPVGSATLIDVTNPMNPVATQVSFAGITADMLDESVRIFGPGASIEQDLEPEYSAFSGDDSKVYVSCQENNCLITVDVATGTVEDIWGYGFKDHLLAGNGLDASNKDDVINIANWPVKGVYMPDAIHSYEVAGQTYIVLANEGDSRDYSGYSEEARVKDVVLDPTAFPNAAELQLEENLGRLLITTSMGDTDGDGDYDELYSFGARSFTIFTAEGDLVYDSGDDIEQRTAVLFPTEFNSTNSGNDSFDNRSDDKGPEPEGVEIGVINGRTYAFIGLERISGVMVYDITDPAAPVYQRFLSNRDFTVDNNALQLDAGAAGDLGPEGLVFIPATDSPDGLPYLVTSNEISGTVTAYALSSSVDAPLAACQLGVVYVSEAHTSGDPEDYIELYNSGAEDCSLAGFQLDDNTALTDLTFGDVVIPAGGYWLGYEDAEGSFASGLSSGGDLVVLGNGMGDQLLVTLGGSIGGYSQSFDADGNGCYTEPTPGADNATCQETQLVTTADLGCTYEGACNFDPTALFDDGSCIYLPGDLSGDGDVDAVDLLDFLAVFGLNCSDL